MAELEKLAAPEAELLLVRLGLPLPLGEPLELQLPGAALLLTVLEPEGVPLLLREPEEQLLPEPVSEPLPPDMVPLLVTERLPEPE